MFQLAHKKPDVARMMVLMVDSGGDDNGDDGGGCEMRQKTSSKILTIFPKASTWTLDF